MTDLPADDAARAPSYLARVRLRYLLMACVTVAVGLAVHTGPLPLAPLAPRLRDASGDALWAMMMVWWIGVLLPSARPIMRALSALGVCVAVEVSQLYHVPWLDAIRATTPGQLVLGIGFDARDLVAYAVGVVVAYFLDGFMHANVPRTDA